MINEEGKQIKTSNFMLQKVINFKAKSLIIISNEFSTRRNTSAEKYQQKNNNKNSFMISHASPQETNDSRCKIMPGKK